MFKNLMIYRVGADWQADSQAVEAALSKHLFERCGATQALSVGWEPPRGEAHAPLLEQIGGHWHLKLGMERRVLPASVVRERVDELAEQIEQQTGRKPGKKARKDLQEQVTLELLPQAFTKRSAVRVWIAPADRLLMLDVGSPARADEVVTLLVQALDGLSLQLLQTAETPAACMAAWLLDGVPPAGFSIDRDCELKSEDEMKSVVRYARHALDTEEVRQHLQTGKRPTRLALTWRDRVSFVLSDTFTLKKIAFLDVVLEGQDKPGKDEAFEADAAIATGELSRLIPDLIHGLGGEHDFLAAAAPAALAPASQERVTEAAPWD